MLLFAGALKGLVAFISNADKQALQAFVSSRGVCLILQIINNGMSRVSGTYGKTRSFPYSNPSGRWYTVRMHPMHEALHKGMSMCHWVPTTATSCMFCDTDNSSYFSEHLRKSLELRTLSVQPRALEVLQRLRQVSCLRHVPLQCAHVLLASVKVIALHLHDPSARIKIEVLTIMQKIVNSQTIGHRYAFLT
jgi:hypothetical protein